MVEKKRTVTRKRLIILLLLFLLLLCIVVGVVFFFSQPNIGKQLADGDKSRVAQLSSDRMRSDVPSGIKKEEGRVYTSCFSYQYVGQYNPIIEEKIGECVVRSSVFDPKGSLTVSFKTYLPGQNFQEDTGLQLRKREKESYQPIVNIDDRFAQRAAFVGNQETTFFADHAGGILVVSLHNFLGNEEERLEIVKQVWDSIEFIEKEN